jgi:hypothetical protein
VTDLQDVPYYLVLTKAERLQGESWTIQVEIVEQELLGALLTDEEPVLEQQVNGNPLMFDIYGLSQQGLAPHQQDNNQNWGLKAFGEQVGQNVMDFDFNIEAVEGDDQALNDFHAMLDMEQEQEEPNEKLTIEIDLNAPANMDTNSYVESVDSDEILANALGIVEEVQIVLALQAAPMNYTIDEIQPQDLMSANPSEGSAGIGVDQAASGDSDMGEISNLQVGMVLLPKNLDIDAGLLSLS